MQLHEISLIEFKQQAKHKEHVHLESRDYALKFLKSHCVGHRETDRTSYRCH